MSFFVRDIYNLSPGTYFEGFFVIENVELKRHRTGDPYLRLVLSDKTGVINALWWKPSRDVNLLEFKKGDVIFVTGYSEVFQGNVQPKLKSMRVAKPGEYSPDKFVSKSRYEVERQYEDLIKIVESIGNLYLKRLLESFFKDERFVELFLKAPGGKLVHHSCVGGLLEHTLGVAELCETVARRYKSIDRDLLICAALLHDIGKVFEYDVNNTIERSTKGMLLGHLYMGAEMVSRAVDDIEGFPEDLKIKLLHCILSHHGEYEHGSPKRPKTLEAVALAYADALDSKVKGFEEHIERELGGSRGWTKKHFVFDVPIFFDGEFGYDGNSSEDRG